MLLALIEPSNRPDSLYTTERAARRDIQYGMQGTSVQKVTDRDYRLVFPIHRPHKWFAIKKQFERQNPLGLTIVPIDVTSYVGGMKYRRIDEGEIAAVVRAETYIAEPPAETADDYAYIR